MGRSVQSSLGLRQAVEGFRQPMSLNLPKETSVNSSPPITLRSQGHAIGKLNHRELGGPEVRFRDSSVRIGDDASGAESDASRTPFGSPGHLLMTVLLLKVRARTRAVSCPRWTAGRERVNWWRHDCRVTNQVVSEVRVDMIIEMPIALGLALPR